MKTKEERQALCDEIDARRWRFIRDRYVKSIQHETNGTSAFTITLPRRRGTTIEAVSDELMGERGSEYGAARSGHPPSTLRPYD